MHLLLTPSLHATLPVGESKRRLLVDLCVVHRSEEIIVEEHDLDLTLVVIVVVVGGDATSGGR
jgi:hypothetical protein